jgi:hypothetical protein
MVIRPVPQATTPVVTLRTVSEEKPFLFAGNECAQAAAAGSRAAREFAMRGMTVAGCLVGASHLVGDFLRDAPYLVLHGRSSGEDAMFARASGR